METVRIHALNSICAPFRSLPQAFAKQTPFTWFKSINKIEKHTPAQHTRTKLGAENRECIHQSVTTPSKFQWAQFFFLFHGFLFLYTQVLSIELFVMLLFVLRMSPHVNGVFKRKWYNILIDMREEGTNVNTRVPIRSELNAIRHPCKRRTNA